MSSVSVVIPAYNSSEFIAGAIESVLDQTLPSVEVVVVDDGSSDNTAEVVHRFVDRDVRLIRQTNAGPAAARNRGWRAATGEYIAFLDADDTFLPNKLECQVAVLTDQPEADFVASGWLVIDENARTLREERPWLANPELSVRTWLFGCPQLPSSVLLRRSALEAVDGFNERIHGVEDWDLFLRLTIAGSRATWLREPVSTYRIHSAQMTQDATKQTRDMARVLDSAFADPRLEQDLAKLRMPALGQMYLRKAGREYRCGQIGVAEADLARAIECNPGLLADRAQRLFEYFVAWACDPATPDAGNYLDAVFEHLPQQAQPLRTRRRQALAAAAMSTCFEAHRSGNWTTMRRALLKALRNDPSWLGNRGVISIAVQSLVTPASARGVTA